MINVLKRIVPRVFRRKLKKIYYFPSDLFRSIFRKNEFFPPKGKTFIGGGDFEDVGNTFLGYFKEMCQLKPDSNVLDIGCGIGRMAIPLTKYLNSEGRFEGFDIVSDGIQWCQTHITPKYPNFNFQLADVFNNDYNPKGRFKASKYKFPFADNNFDLIYLTSVFTHMVPEDVENYFSEICRVLKTGGKSLITYFLLNDDTKNLMESRKSPLDFKYNFGLYSSTHEKVPETILGLNEDFVLGLYSKYKMVIDKPIHYGSFCGRDKYLSYQDIIIATKL